MQKENESQTKKQADTVPAAKRSSSPADVQPSQQPESDQEKASDVAASLVSAIHAADPPAPQKEPAASPTDKIYTELTKVFGNSNPRQLFSLVWPGTVLNAESYTSLDNGDGATDPLVQISQSLLFDQHYPIAPVTQPDGTRISDRYKQAVESYGPIPNERLLDLQRTIRSRLDQQVLIDINGVMTQVSLLEKFSILQERWILKKREWADLKSKKYDELKASGGAEWWHSYVTWYENNADSYIEAINAAYNRMVADFPLSEFEDAIAILDTHDGVALQRAKQDVRNAEVSVPPDIGSSFYSTLATPNDWGKVLRPTTTFIDLLAAPDAQQRYQDLCVDQLSQQIYAFNAILAQIPKSQGKTAIEQALNDFHDASTAYASASSELIKTYTDNTVLAVKTYLQYKQGTDEDKTADANALIPKLNADNGKPGNQIGGKDDWGKIATAIGDAQKKLVDDTTGMIAKGQHLGDAASKYLQSGAGAGLRELVQPILDKLNSQLNTLVTSISNFDASAGRAITVNEPAPAAGVNTPDPAFSSPVDSAINQRWDPITFTVTSEDMSTGSNTSTAFSQSDWSVDLFFGSAGGEDKSASESFATQYMSSDSSIQIGMLATKVIIDRPWMHPEVFALSKKYFKATDGVVTTPPDKTYTKDDLLAAALGGAMDPALARDNCSLLNEGTFPGYSVALLLVKDVTIKIKLKAAQTQALQDHSEKTVSNGGGFLCFSVSKTESSTSDSKSVSSYAMGGDYVFRIPAPQIIGVWNQILPPDKSTYLDSSEIERSLQFKVSEHLSRSVTKIKPYSETPPRRDRPPV